MLPLPNQIIRTCSVTCLDKCSFQSKRVWRIWQIMDSLVHFGLKTYYVITKNYDKIVKFGAKKFFTRFRKYVLRLLFEVFQSLLKVSWLLKRFRKTMPSKCIFLPNCNYFAINASHNLDKQPKCNYFYHQTWFHYYFSLFFRSYSLTSAENHAENNSDE